MLKPSLTGAAFIARAKGRANALHTDVGICNTAGTTKRRPTEYSAIWDTGATGTSITSKVVADCQLVPISKTYVTGVHGTKLSNVYLVDVYLPNKVIVKEVKAVEAPGLAGGAEVLIGMDIISLGDFAVNNFQGKTSFTFRIPSLERIDFTSTPLPKPTPSGSEVAKVGRNDPCPCESGKKYKRCHGA